MRTLVPFTLLLAGIACFINCAARSAAPGQDGPLNEPGLIDVHAHIGEFKGYDLSLNTLLAEITEHRVEAALISNIDGAALPGVTADGDEVKINEETARVAAAHPRLKPLAWAKPGAAGAGPSNLEPFLRDRGFLGIKFHPEFNRFSPDAEAVTGYLRLCEKYGVPALFHCGSARSGAPAIYAVARRFPAVPFVLYHMGFGTNHEEAIEVARAAKDKGDALIYLETAQADAGAVVRAIKTVGADRVVFGSDATYYGRGHYRQYAPMLRAVKREVAAEDYARFIGGNARQLFRLEPPRR